MQFARAVGFSWFVSACALSLACGGDPEVTIPPGSAGNAGAGGNGGGSGGRDGSGGGLIIPEGGKGGTGGMGEGGSSGDPCDALDCGPGQRCEVSAGVGACEDNTCVDLKCTATEECQPVAPSGAACVSIVCDSDVDCPISRYCNGTKCVDDVCEPDTRTCNGNSVEVCPSNGGPSDSSYTCKSAGYFDSTCQDGTGTTGAGCDCEGDWDCPEYTVCEAKVCKGTGKEPTCTLPPTPFEDVLPQLEFRWGGANTDNQDATGKAFPWSAQVSSAPVVINLNDDNGDGLVNELDFPEILFMSYHGGNPDLEGVVRAVHAGGPDKGQDYFALCGAAHWFEGAAPLTDCNPRDSNAESRTAALGRASGMLAAGDLDNDGVPEIVVPLETGGFQILTNRGAIISTSAANLWPSVAGDNDWRYPAPAIANLDFDGLAEIVLGNRVVTLTKDANGALVVDRVFTGVGTVGTMPQGSNAQDPGDEHHFGPTTCLADLTSDPGLEIVAGTSLYRLPDAANCNTQPTSDFCEDRLTLVWAGRTANPGSTFYVEGFCAVADVLGADTDAAPGPENPLDGVPEVLVMANGRLLILQSEDGTALRNLDLGGGFQGGAPNVDDFDGDGFPEISTALSDFYVVTDLQDPEATHCPAWPDVLRQGQAPPDGNPARDPGAECTTDDDCNAGAVCNVRVGACVCLHSGWRRDTEDDSSKVTSSSVFDFNGDGAAEVVYNDECYFRVYDGATGGTYLQLPSLSRTIIENPVVADMDNDGNAEIAFVTNNETIQCGDADGRPGSNSNLNSWPDGVDDVERDSLPNGLEVWGDPSDIWVTARRIWNQHAYHVTNVTEGGQIPLHEPESWKPLNGRIYNTYRSQPRNYGVAPDLTLTDIQITSPNVACGELSDEIEISVLVKNQGDLRVGPGVEITFTGIWTGPRLIQELVDANGDPLTFTLTTSLEPGASTIVSVIYQAGNNGRPDLPAEVAATVDAAEAERECEEGNNEITGPVEGGEALADLRLVVDRASGCAAPRVTVTVFNDGAAPAEDILVRLYAGDPSAGGQVLGETTIAGPIEPGDSQTVTVTLDALNRTVTIWGITDPLNTVDECNDANNRDRGPELVCDDIPI